SSLAESMNAHVLTTSTSASSALAVISIPCCKTLPSMISASTRFLAQPRLIIPTFVRCSGGRVARIESKFAPKAFGASTSRRFMLLLNGDFGVTFSDRLAVLFDLDGVAIEDAHREMLSGEFYRAVCRRNPTLERRGQGLVIHHHFNVRFLERLNRHAVGSGRLCRILCNSSLGQIFRANRFRSSH